MTVDDLNISYRSTQYVLVNVFGINLLQKRHLVEVAEVMLDNVAEDVHSSNA